MPPVSNETASRRVRLGLAGNWDEGLTAGVLPWLRKQVAQAWRDRRPTVVLVPSRAYGFYLHERVVAEGFNLVSLHFWTPSDARTNLLKFYPGIKPTPSQEVLHLLATLAAEDVVRRDPTNRTATAIAAEPSSFIKTVDQLAGAGWDLGSVAEAPLGAVVKRWRALLAQHGFQTVQEIDRELIVRAEAEEPKLAQLLMCGFDGSRWPEWAILQAVTAAAAEAEIVLVAPKLGWEEIDQAWIGTWEERFGASEPCVAGELNETTAQPYAPLQTALHAHLRAVDKESGSIEFYLGRNVRREAEAIVASAIGFLQREDCSRLGIVFPGVCPLAREVAALVDAAGLSCDDSFGFTQPGSFEREDWRAWLEFQESPSLERLFALLEFVPPSRWLSDQFSGASRTVSTQDVESSLREAFKEVLLDDLAVLASWLRASTRKHDRDRAALECLEALAPLPERARWCEFLSATVAAMRRLGWTERAELIELGARSADFLKEMEMSRPAFLRWLGEVAISTRKVRGAASNHRYSRVHLLNYNEAEKQQWSHLILTSLSESVWPPSNHDSGFLSRSEVMRLNRSVRRLNVNATTEGSQGEGHVQLEAGKGICLGAFERRLLAESQLLGILENVSTGLALTARLGEEKSSGQVLVPGEFISRLYELKTGRVLNDSEVEKVCVESERTALQSLSALSVPSSKTESGSFDQAALAYSVRRQSGKPFGEYEFCLRKPLSTPPRLSCGEWESALKEPAVMWMRKFLRVAPVEETNLESCLLPVRGTWTHRWLAGNGQPRSNQFVPWPTRAEMLGGLERQAGMLRGKVEEVLRESGRTLPIWWTSLWREARFQSRELLAVLEPAWEWPGFSTEYKLAATECDFSNGALPPLRLEGRIDLLMAWELSMDDLLPHELWLVDFKTGGASRALTSSDMKKGNGVQLALYALALRQLGATAVQASLLRPGELLREQMSLEKFDELRECWRELQRMQVEGAFGVHGELRSEYRHSKAYPLATLAIDSDLLQEKWTLTHPAWSEVA